jgi:hypothetical protein
VGESRPLLGEGSRLSDRRERLSEPGEVRRLRRRGHEILRKSLLRSEPHGREADARLADAARERAILCAKLLECRDGSIDLDGCLDETIERGSEPLEQLLTLALDVRPLGSSRPPRSCLVTDLGTL